MKTLFATLIVATLAMNAAPAIGAVYSVGGPLSYKCYRAAQTHDNGRFAVDGCTRSLEIEALSDADRAATYVNRGVLYLHRGELQRADADFDSAVAINARLAEAYLNKGYLRLRTGSGREALTFIQQGLDRGGDRQAVAWFARGVAYEQIGDYKSAYADLKKAQALAPGWTMPAEYLADYRIVR